MSLMRLCSLACAATLLSQGFTPLRAEGSVAASAFSLSIPVGLALSGGGEHEDFLSAAALGGASVMLVAVKVSHDGVTWILERASDGGRISLKVVAKGGQSLAMTAGKTLSVSATASGYALSWAGAVVLFIPTMAGMSLVFSDCFSQ